MLLTNLEEWLSGIQQRGNNMSKIENNKVARVHYTGTLPDTKEIFDSSEGENH